MNVIPLKLAAPRTSRCFDYCPELQREVDDSHRLRALLAQLLERLPQDDPLVHEGWKALE